MISEASKFTGKTGKTSILLILILTLAFTVTFLAAPAPAAAKSKTKSVKLLKYSGVKYYKSGLVKSIAFDASRCAAFQYDSKGRIKALKTFGGSFDKEDMNGILKFSYTKKGKLKSVLKAEYVDGKAVSKEVCDLKVGKKNRIAKLKWTGTTETDTYTWTYDSKGRVKKMIEQYYRVEDGDVSDSVARTTVSRTSKGYPKKISCVIEQVFGGETEKYSFKTSFKTSSKSGRATAIKYRGEYEYGTHKCKYTKKKIKTKFVSAVNAQQKELPYLFASGAESTSPVLYLSTILY